MTTDRLPSPPTGDAVRRAFERRLGVDARALAAFRIALGLTLLFDTLHRSRNLVAFYTDEGVLPRDAPGTVGLDGRVLDSHAVRGTVGAGASVRLFGAACGFAGRGVPNPARRGALARFARLRSVPEPAGSERR
ncbi:hypothetical protein [Halobiforma nitratireducens]|uniref:HTTM domain-containing protein n=1 Tax=Halobiforma nitratireducens JCM 10879 TaxID=1227454 RepID=M0M9I7_9EURY|nr:hypothetical protein [Halobiforma nitratireducens]EMA42416.1 HTTM domain-containing protein [Halobiforma nitratireducens JCM 10879]